MNFFFAENEFFIKTSLHANKKSFFEQKLIWIGSVSNHLIETEFTDVRAEN